MPCVPAWSTCLHASVPKVCQNFIFMCQHANKRANVTTCHRRANMPKTCQFSNCVPTNQKACQFFNRAPSVTAFEWRKIFPNYSFFSTLVCFDGFSCNFFFKPVFHSQKLSTKYSLSSSNAL